MKDNDNADGFAQKYWETFEELVCALLKNKLGNDNSYNFHFHKTQARKDGGYDGIIIIKRNSNFADSFRELYTILVEAKLRKNDNKDLPLSDFAKTLIIAINRNAMEVRIFTNLHFSIETQKRITQFSAATSLAVQLIDLWEICDEIKHLPEIQRNYPEEFLKQLFDSLPLHNIKKRIKYKPESIFTATLPPLVGDYRNGLRDKYINYIKQHTGVFVFSGIQGTGKSLLMKHIINELQYEINCKIIELEKFSTIKEFFVYILSIIWNVSTVDIYNLTEDSLDEIILFLPEQQMSKRVKSILVNILGGKTTEYENRQDVFEGHLIEYLYYIFIPICKRKKQLFAFTNLEKCGENILNFTNKFIRKFSSENIIILTEIRTDVPRLKTYIEEWSLLNEDVEPIQLSEFTYMEYYEYMQNEYPEMNSIVIKNLHSICFPLPLYIENLVSYINKNDLLPLLFRDELNIKKLFKNENFRENFILFSLKNFFHTQKEECKKLAYIIGFFDGALSLENIIKLGENYRKAAIELSNSIYFDLEKNILHVHHILYLKTLQKESILNPYEYNEIWYLLYNTIDCLKMDDTEIKELKKLEIAINYSEKCYVSCHWKKMCDNLIRQNDFTLAKRILENIFEKKSLHKDDELCLINKIIRCYLGLNEYKSLNLSNYINLGEDILCNCPIYQEKVFFYYLKSKYYFSIGKYHDIISITKIYLNENAQIRFIRALSIKHIYGIDACLLCLERGKKYFPSDWYLQYSYLDHLHSKYEKIDYEKSLNILNEIEQYWDKLELEDHIHYDYNKITLELYKTGSIDIKICHELLVKTFENVLPIENGRIHNLLGQVHYLNGDIESAQKEFEKALKILEKHIHTTYIYVPLVNLTLLYSKHNNIYMCLQYAIKSMEYFINYKKEKIERQLSDYNNIVIEKECASFIVVMEIIEKIDPKLFEKYSSIFLNYNLKIHSSSKLPQYCYLNDIIIFRC